MALRADNITKKFGDSTVINGFSHEFKPSSGIIENTAKRIAPVFQEDRLCENLSALSNLRLVMRGKPDRALIETELAAVGLTDCADKPVRDLSGGMKRRIALLRALLAEYEILFLDEPFKGLDDATKQTVMEYCRHKTAGRTVILITHDKSEAVFFGGETIILE